MSALGSDDLACAFAHVFPSLTQLPQSTCVPPSLCTFTPLLNQLRVLVAHVYPQKQDHQTSHPLPSFPTVGSPCNNHAAAAPPRGSSVRKPEAFELREGRVVGRQGGRFDRLQVCAHRRSCCSRRTGGNQGSPFRFSFSHRMHRPLAGSVTVSPRAVQAFQVRPGSKTF